MMVGGGVVLLGVVVVMGTVEQMMEKVVEVMVRAVVEMVMEATVK